MMEQVYGCIRSVKGRYRVYARKETEGVIFQNGDYADRKTAKARLLEAYPAVKIITRREWSYMAYLAQAQN